MNSGTNLRGITVVDGRASNTNQNPLYAGQNPWSDRLGEVYQTVLPSSRARTAPDSFAAIRLARMRSLDRGPPPTRPR